MDPKWARPDADFTIAPKKVAGPKRKAKEKQLHCACGCGVLAGYSTRHPWKALRYIHGHQGSKAGVTKIRALNDMAYEVADREAREERADFHGELDRLFEEAREQGLSGNAMIAYVFTEGMEEQAVRRVLERAVLEGNRDAINWAFSRKHGTPSSKPAPTAPPPEAPSFLDPLASEDEVYE